MDDRWDLQRFVQAQDPVFDAVCAELRAGRKRTHWMWFVFPQLGALGHSATAVLYGLSGLAEATAYRAHPVLGARLDLCTRLVLAIKERRAPSIFAFPDDLKPRSSMTRFDAVADDDPAFSLVLDRLHAGQRDDRTLELLACGC